MTDETDLRGSRCSTLTDDRRTRIEQADERSKKGLTLCTQSLWDCDNYLARSFGTLYKSAYNHLSPVSKWKDVSVRLDWCDHGTTTHYFLNGYHIGNQPSAQVSPRVYLESIWSAGRLVAQHLASEWRDREESSR